jgi:hypothetical protein
MESLRAVFMLGKKQYMHTPLPDPAREFQMFCSMSLLPSCLKRGEFLVRHEDGSKSKKMKLLASL